MNNGFDEKTKGFVFDVDNTLVDTTAVFAKQYDEFRELLEDAYGDEDRANVVFEEFNTGRYSINGKYKNTLDLNYIAEDFVNLIAKRDGLEGEILDEMKKVLIDIYHIYAEPLGCAYELLNLLNSKGYSIGFWTHSGEEWTERKVRKIVSHTDIKYEDIFVEGVPLDLEKDVNSLKDILKKMNLKPEEVVVVGDNMVSDIISGAKAGVVDMVWLRGNINEEYAYKDNSVVLEECCVDLRVVDSLCELVDLVE